MFYDATATHLLTRLIAKKGKKNTAKQGKERWKVND